MLESTRCHRVGTPQGRFVHVSRVENHWVTMSNLDCQQEGGGCVTASTTRHPSPTNSSRIIGISEHISSGVNINIPLNYLNNIPSTLAMWHSSA